MGQPNPKGDDTQVVDDLTGHASKVSGRSDCKPPFLGTWFSEALHVVAGSEQAVSVAVVKLFFCDVCDSCLLCNVWLKK